MAKLEISRIGEILKLLPFKEKEEDINGEKNKKLDFRMRPAEAIFTNKEVKPKFKHKGKADKG